MFNLRKIDAKNETFITLREKSTEWLNGYFDFLESETIERGKSMQGKSGKSRSYCDYLVKLLLIVNENEKIELEINSYEFQQQLSQMFMLEKFSMFNRSENSFPSATINSYFRYINKITNEEDLYEAHSSADIDIAEKKSFENYIAEPTKIRRSITRTSIENRRSQSEKAKAFVKSNYTCEAECDHKLFNNSSNGLPYVEAHHLIPLSFQFKFPYSLDVHSNIISLCPSCHRKIHYAQIEDREELIVSLFDIRNEDLKKSGINIKISDLIQMYQ